VARHERLHQTPRDQVAERADDEHDEVGGLRLVLENVGEMAGEHLHDDAADAARHRADAGDRGDGFFWGTCRRRL